MYLVACYERGKLGQWIVKDHCATDNERIMWEYWLRWDKKYRTIRYALIQDSWQVLQDNQSPLPASVI